MFIDGGGSTGGLFLKPIPVPPGDPGALSKAAGTYTAAHGELERQQARLTGLAGQAGGTRVDRSRGGELCVRHP